MSLGPAEVIECMENEYNFNSEVALGATSYMWQDKYKLRMPCFFNRLHTVCGAGCGVCALVWGGTCVYASHKVHLCCLCQCCAAVIQCSYLCRSLAKVLKTLLFCAFMLAHPMG